MPQIINQTPGLLAGLQNASNSLATAQGLTQDREEHQSRQQESQARQQQYAQNRELGNQRIAANAMQLEQAQRQEQERARTQASGELVGRMRVLQDSRSLMEQGYNREAAEIVAVGMQGIEGLPPEAIGPFLADLEAQGKKAQVEGSKRNLANQIESAAQQGLLGDNPEAAQMTAEMIAGIGEDDPRAGRGALWKAATPQLEKLKQQAQRAGVVQGLQDRLGVPLISFDGGDGSWTRGMYAAAAPQLQMLSAQYTAGLISDEYYNQQANRIIRGEEDRFQEFVQQGLRAESLRSQALSDLATQGYSETDPEWQAVDRAWDPLTQALGRMAGGGQRQSQPGPDGGGGGAVTTQPVAGPSVVRTEEQTQQLKDDLARDLQSGNDAGLEERLQKEFPDEDEAAEFMRGVLQSQEEAKNAAGKKRVVGAVAKPVGAAAKAGAKSLVQGVTTGAGLAVDSVKDVLTSAVVGDEKGLAVAVTKIPTAKLTAFAAAMDGVNNAGTRAQAAFILEIAPDAEKLLDKATGKLSETITPILTRIGKYLAKEKAKRL